MAIEIELKARVDAPETLKNLLDHEGNARFIGVFDKEDAYWYPATGTCAALPASGVRVRAEKKGGVQTTLVTYKTKEVRNEIEVNNEREFSVSDTVVFEELLTALGLAPRARKHKHGCAWTYNESAVGVLPNITVELAFVEGLGCFVELEILARDDEPETVASSRARLLALLERLGIDKSSIETRYYTELLKEAGREYAGENNASPARMLKCKGAFYE
jgi:adenylate cyclase class 2